MFLLVPAHPGSPGQRAVKRLLCVVVLTHGRGLPFAGGFRHPSNTMWPGLRSISLPSGILIHPAVWPQYTNVRDRQTGWDGTGQTTV